MTDLAPAPAAAPLTALDRLEWALIPVGMLVQLVCLPHGLIGDDIARAHLLGSLLENGRIDQVKYSFAGPIFAAPFWWVGKLLGSPTAALAGFDWALFCVGLAAFYLLLRGRWSPAALRRFLLLLVAGSMFPRHLMHFGAEAFTALTAGFGLAAVGLGLERLGWPVTLLAALNTPANTVGLGFASLRWSWEQRRLRYLAVPVAAAVCIFFETWLRMGQPFRTGYEQDFAFHTVMPYSGLPGMSYPLFFGLLSILLSFGRGLIFFAPGLLLLAQPTARWAQPRLAPPLRLWLSYLLGLILLYSKFQGWYGGVSAGPRYFLFASLPATLLLAELLARCDRRPDNQETGPGLWLTLSAFLLVALSCWGTIATTVFDTGGMEECTRNNYALEHLCWYTPEFSVLWNPFVYTTHAFDHLTPLQWVVIGYGVVVFAAMAAPLLDRLVRQLSERLRTLQLAANWRL